jgi:hypothetical protein
MLCGVFLMYMRMYVYTHVCMYLCCSDVTERVFDPKHVSLYVVCVCMLVYACGCSYLIEGLMVFKDTWRHICMCVCMYVCVRCKDLLYHIAKC